MGIIAFEKGPGFLLESSRVERNGADRVVGAEENLLGGAKLLIETAKDRRAGLGVRRPQHTPLTVGRGDDEGAIYWTARFARRSTSRRDGDRKKEAR